MGEVLQVLGAIAATAAAGTAILTRNPRLRAAAMLVALALAVALIAGEAWDSQIKDLRDKPAELAALAVAVIAAGAILLRLGARMPVLVPLGLLAALPFRISIHTGGESSNLLLPLYVVIAAGVLLEWRRAASADSTSPASTAAPGVATEGPIRPAPPEPLAGGALGVAEEAPVDVAAVEEGRLRRIRDSIDGNLGHWLSLALVASIVLYAAQSAYSSDVSRAVQNVGFFLVPFAVMFVLLREAEWTPRLVRIAFFVVVGEAVLFAAVGIVQHEVGHIFWNDKVVESNEFDVYFRVNSLFWDPNIYGRYLALAGVVGVAALLWLEDARRFAIGATAVAVIFLGMAFSFSQTSFFAFLAGLAVLSALRWSLRRTLVAAAVGVLAAAAVLAFTSALEVHTGASNTLQETTSGRSTLVSGGLDLAKNRPLAGYGSGSFAVEFEKRNAVPRGEAAISHTEPVTVAAEQGVLGLAAYAALLLAALLTVFGGLRSIAPGLGGEMPWGLDAGAQVRTRAIARIAVAAAFVGLLVHTIGYAGFLIDPLSWALLALGAALAVTRRPAPAFTGTSSTDSSSPASTGTSSTDSSSPASTGTSSASPPGVPAEDPDRVGRIGRSSEGPAEPPEPAEPA